jgi:hypothetical protein
MTNPISVARDERGELLAVELERLPFDARRVFIASSPPDGATRGNHAIPCAQLMILVSGRAEVELGPDADRLAAPVILDTPGASLALPVGHYVRYRLDGPASQVLVLAAEAYQPSER